MAIIGPRGVSVIGELLCKHLGIAAKRVSSITLNFSAGKVPTMTIIRYVDSDDIKFLTEIYEATEWKEIIENE